jgi:hypothetical protein
VCQVGFSSSFCRSLRSSRAASVAILPSALFIERFFARCKLGVLKFSRCCYLIIGLDSHFFDGSWARHQSQSPELGG